MKGNLKNLEELILHSFNAMHPRMAEPPWLGTASFELSNDNDPECPGLSRSFCFVILLFDVFLTVSI